MLESLSKEAVVQKCSVKRMFLKISQNSEACNFIKNKTLAQVFSGEFCEISKNTFSYGTPPGAASVSNTVKCVQAVRLATLLKRDPSTGVSKPAIRRSSTK